MMIELELPDTTMGCFVNFIFYDGNGMIMGNKTIDDELYLGKKIICIGEEYANKQQTERR